MKTKMILQLKVSRVRRGTCESFGKTEKCVDVEFVEGSNMMLRFPLSFRVETYTGYVMTDNLKKGQIVMAEIPLLSKQQWKKEGWNLIQ